MPIREVGNTTIQQYQSSAVKGTITAVAAIYNRLSGTHTPQTPRHEKLECVGGFARSTHDMHDQVSGLVTGVGCLSSGVVDGPLEPEQKSLRDQE